MTDNLYQKALDAAKKELAQLVIQKDEIDKRVARLRQTIASLAALNEEINPEDGEVYVPSGFERSTQLAVQGITTSIFGKKRGFTDVVRDVLKAADRPLTAMDVRDGLLRMGINLEEKYTNPLAVVAKTLTRLQQSGEVRGANKNGKKAYQWKRETYLSKFGKETYDKLTAEQKQQLQDARTFEDAVKLIESFNIKMA